MKNVLFCWVGHADLTGMNSNQTKGIRELVESTTGKKTLEQSSDGPVKVALSQRPFDRVILLWSYADRRLIPEFKYYLNFDAEIYPNFLENPSDYTAVYKTAEAVLKALNINLAAEKIFYLLSPGTPAMAAVLLLLGKTKYPGAFLQTYQNALKEVSLPFNLSLEVIPELLHKSDSVIQSISATEQMDCDEGIIGTGPAMKNIINQAAHAALYDVPVLLTGESGSGKEMFARTIWRNSRRKDKPFEAINCAALPGNLLESELFGHEKGAFTGAMTKRAGAFARANGGTLFLDEIGECSPELQAKLLRVLQPLPNKPITCREFYPVGSDKPVRTNVRIIAATNRDLLSMIEAHTFREDLYYRLAVINLRIPPLREHKEDIPKLAEAFLKKGNEEFRKGIPFYQDKFFSEETIKFLMQARWKGNIRELRNAVLQGIVMADGPEILPETINLSSAFISDELENRATENYDLDSAKLELEETFVKRALTAANGNKTQAARLLKFSNYQRLDALIKKLRKLGKLA